MHLYTFTNNYIHTIQHGIQTTHILGEMIAKYGSVRDLPFLTIMDWATDHKTIHVLDGGFSSDLNELHQYFLKPEHSYPWAYFSEDVKAIGNIDSFGEWTGVGALTVVGIILPDKLYDLNKALREGASPVYSITHPFNVSEWEMGMAIRLSQHRLAR